MEKLLLDNSKCFTYDVNVGLVPVSKPQTSNIKNEKMLLSNNSRKIAGLPLLRKKNSKKRFYTRCEISESVDAFLDYCHR